MLETRKWAGVQYQPLCPLLLVSYLTFLLPCPPKLDENACALLARLQKERQTTPVLRVVQSACAVFLLPSSLIAREVLANLGMDLEEKRSDFQKAKEKDVLLRNPCR